MNLYKKANVCFLYITITNNTNNIVFDKTTVKLSAELN